MSGVENDCDGSDSSADEKNCQDDPYDGWNVEGGKRRGIITGLVRKSDLWECLGGTIRGGVGGIAS